MHKLLKIGTYEGCKISLSFFDDKRYILDDGTNTFAYFHRDITNQWNWVKSIELLKLVKSIKLIDLIRLIESNQVNNKFPTRTFFFISI